MVISLEAEKDFDSIEHSFMLKVLVRLEINSTYLNIIKAIYSKTTASIKLRETRINFN